MVISHIIGGIGNQMFQYAAGRALSLANRECISVDITDFSKYPLHHGFELKRVFNVNAESASAATIREMLGWRAYPLARRVLRRASFRRFRGSRFIAEPHFNYWPDFYDLTGDCYLYGYWQSERYFKQFEQAIRLDFTFRQQLRGKNVEEALAIADSQSVSLHVRRGDYISNKKNSTLLTACSLDYYRAAIQYVVERIERPNFFIFSDDPTWVKENVKIDFPCCYVDHNQGAESYNDMRLMSMCKHHIIANSSFSWWAAWLNPNPVKIVVAPRKWFANNNDISDLFPSGWVTL